MVSNYIPISLPPNLDKIIVKLMHRNLPKFLEDKNFLYYKHFGYRKNFSTSNAIINLIENIQ